MNIEDWDLNSAQALDIFHDTALAKFQPEPGSVCINRSIIQDALRILKGEVFAEEGQKIGAFACFAQLIDSVVLHEKVYFRDLAQAPLSDRSEVKPASELIQPLPGISEFESRASRLIIEHDSQDIVGVQPNQLTMDLLAASVAGIPYKPGPFHTALAKRIIHERESDYYRAFASWVLTRTKHKAQQEIDEMNELLGEMRFKLDSPLVFNYVFSNYIRGQKNIFETAMAVRESKEARAFRAVCAEVDLAARVGDSKTLYRLKDELEAVTHYLNLKFQQPTVEVSVELPLSISLNPHMLWNTFQQRRKRHLLFIENIYKAALQSEGLRRQFFELF